MVGAIHSLSAGFPCNCCGCNLLSLFSPLHSRSASIHVPMHSLCTGWNDVVPVVIQNELVVAMLFLSFFLWWSRQGDPLCKERPSHPNWLALVTRCIVSGQKQKNAVSTCEADFVALSVPSLCPEG